MRTMSGGPCLHYDCSNRNSFGYCKTTACINEHYQQEQCGLQSTMNHYNELMQSVLTAQKMMLECGIEANSVTLNGRKYGKLIENLPPNMKPTVFGMAVKAEYAMSDDYDFLVQYEPPQPKTNADRIRSMTDEELADKFEKIQLNAVKAYGNDHLLLEGELKKYWLDWLKKEAEE